MRRILEGQWLLAGLTVAVPFMGCAGGQSSDGEPLGRVEQATDAHGFHSTTLSDAPFGDLNEHVHRSADGLSPVPADWNMMLTTKGLTSLVVKQNTWDPGGSTGWHTHPGPSLITITSGSLTVYDGNCTPHVFSAGDGGTNSAFVDVGGGDVHLVRNDTSAPATAVVVQFVGASVSLLNRRIGADPPLSCPVPPPM